MPVRIEIFSHIFDARASLRMQLLERLGFAKKISKVFLADVYTIDKQFSEKKIKRIVDLLTNPVTQYSLIRYGATKPIQKTAKGSKLSFRYALEIGYLPGVTDNVANTAKEIIEDLFRISFSTDEGVYSSQIMFIEGMLSKKELKGIADSFHNPLIQRVQTKEYMQFKKDGGMNYEIPRVFLADKPTVVTVNMDVSDIELKQIGKLGIANPDGSRRGPLALDISAMKAIQSFFKKQGRDPTDVELESLAQTWSEHCKHTIFSSPIDDIPNGLFKTYIKGATEKIRGRKRKDICVSVFSDNSGAIAFNREYLITHKVETHNTPSALDPFGGAITGIVGVNRDAIGFGLGAKPIINTYGYCLANYTNNTTLYKGPNKTQKMLSAKRIMEGVIEGVNKGGNCSGIPSPQGFLYFDDRYRGKPLVFAGTVGLIPRFVNGKPSHEKKAMPGDYIVMAGGYVGKDGIHGATFSSEALDSGSPVTAVQIGDPITQKKLSDAVIKEARDLGMYSSITDNGAGGLSCSVSEMAKESGGCVVDLDKVPLKYPGLQPWEIWISESQERMTFAVPQKKWEQFAKLMKRRGVHASVIGIFTDSGSCVVRYRDTTVMDLPLQFLHDGLPVKKLQTQKVTIMPREPVISHTKDLTKIFLSLTGRPNIASYSFVSEQYDHIVQGGLVLPPLQGRGKVNADATIVRPILSSQKGILISQALYPSYGDIDMYAMAASCIDSAIRQVVATGADPDAIALLDNFCWSSSDDPVRLWQLKEATKACYDTAVAFGAPFISGKDSMYNDFKGFDSHGKPSHIAIPPTLLISSVSVIDEAASAISIDVKQENDLVYILGETHDETGGSEYFRMLSEKQGGLHTGRHVPTVNAKKNKKLYDVFYAASKAGLIASAISIGRGGLGIALAKSAMAGMLGIRINLSLLPGNTKKDDSCLFSESQGRILVSIAPDKRLAFEKQCTVIPFACIGRVTKNPDFIIEGMQKKTVVSTSVEDLLNVYRKTFSGL